MNVKDYFLTTISCNTMSSVLFIYAHAPFESSHLLVHVLLYRPSQRQNAHRRLLPANSTAPYAMMLADVVQLPQLAPNSWGTSSQLHQMLLPQ
jgi:hypothetical protein